MTIEVSRSCMKVPASSTGRVNRVAVLMGLVHPSGATRAYAWSHRTEGRRRRFLAVLALPPVDSALMAVRAHIMAESEKRKN